MDYRSIGKEIILSEAKAVHELADRLDDNFNAAATAILQCTGRVIVSGMGKSGIIGRKLAATFNSTGLASFFLHPAEAMHGDLGLMRSDDILLLISKSGLLDEAEMIFAMARRLEIPVIALCGTPGSPLATRADIMLDCSVAEEACPDNLVPTSSSTAALVMGDALALALLKARNFSADDFAALHPGGSLGRRLLRTVAELHHSGDGIPLIDADATVSEMIIEMTGKRLGCVVMKGKDGSVGGIFTDGDLRRLVERGQDVYNLKAGEVMIRNPKRVAQSALIDTALALMEKHSITALPTVDEHDHLAGIIHLHDILRSKLV